MYAQPFKTQMTTGFGETTWLDAVISAGDKLAQANAKKRQEANAKAEADRLSAARQQAFIQSQSAGAGGSNILMYAGIGAAVLILGGLAYWKLKPKTA